MSYIIKGLLVVDKTQEYIFLNLYCSFARHSKQENSIGCSLAFHETILLLWYFWSYITLISKKKIQMQNLYVIGDLNERMLGV